MNYRTHTITINGDRWKYRAMKPEAFLRVYPDKPDTSALTLYEKRRMDFIDGHLDFGTIVHELTHAYCHYLYLNSASVTHSQFEEIICEMMEAKILTIVEQANRMLARMTGGQSDVGRKEVRSEQTPHGPDSAGGA